MGMVEATDWAWLAGIVDGEGCLQISRSKSKGGGVFYGAHVRVDMTHLPTMDRIAAVLDESGIAHGRYLHNRKNNKHKTSYIVDVGQMPMISKLLEALEPYLVTKREQATLLGEYVKRRLSLARRDSRGMFAASVTVADDEAFEAMRVLNRRGLNG